MKERSITTDITTLQRIMITTMNNYIPVNWKPRKKCAFTETHNIPRLNQEETENLIRLIISNQIELIIKTPPSLKI